MRIKIGDDILDATENIRIAQNYSVNELGKIETRQGGFSNNFSIPLTGRNKKILGIPDDINSASRKPYQKVEASLIDLGVPVASGYLRYQIVSNNQLQASFFSDNSEWFSLLKGKSLNDLDLWEYDHNWDINTMKTAIDADKTSGYTYPLIDYNDAFSGSTTLEVDFTTSDERLYPAMFVSTLVERIFYEVGWKVDGEMIDHPKYKRLIIPFSAKTFRHQQRWIDDNAVLTIYGQIDSGDPAESIDFGEPGIYDFSGSFSELVGTDQYTVTIYKNAGSVFTRTYTAGTAEIFFSIEGITLESGDTFTIELTSTGSAEISGDITATPRATIVYGASLQISEIMPDVQQIDVIKYLVMIFGAIPQANSYNKTVTFNLFRSIKNNIPNALDWSNKIDMGKNISHDYTQLLNNYKASSILNYSEDSNDDELVAYLEETNQNFGQGKFVIDNEHLNGEAEIYTAPFTPLINVNTFNNKMYIPHIMFKKNATEPESIEPKIALLSTNITVNKLSVSQFSNLTLTDSSGSLTCSSIPFCWFAKTQFISEVNALLDSLAFDQILFSNAVGAPIIEDFLEDYEDIFSSMKYIKAYFKLNEVDINSLDFTIPVFISHYKSYFYINKINSFTGGGKTTEVELIKIYGLSANTVRQEGGEDGMQDSDLITMADSDNEVMEDGSITPSTGWVAGTPFTLPGTNEVSLGGMTSTRIAYIGSTDELTAYDLASGVWSQAGNKLTLGGGDHTLAGMSSTNAAQIDTINEDLTMYTFNGTNWSQVGNQLNIPGIGAPTLTDLSSTRVAFYDGTLEELRTYDFDGTNWSLTGSGLSIPFQTKIFLAGTSNTRVAALILGGSSWELRTYDFDGSNWAQTGNSLALSGSFSNMAICLLDGTTDSESVAIVNGSTQIITQYDFDGTDWTQVGIETGIVTAGQSDLAFLSATEVAYADDSADKLTYYEYIP